MQTQKYSIQQPLIESLLTWVKEGEIAIPEIQRPFVWDKSKVRGRRDGIILQGVLKHEVYYGKDQFTRCKTPNPHKMNSSSTFGQAYAGVRQYLLKDRRKKVYIIGGVLLIAGLLWAGYLEGGETVETAGTTHGHGETHGTTDTQQDMNFLERVKRGLFSGHFVKEHLIHLTSAIIIGFIVLLFLKGDEKIDEEHRELLLLVVNWIP
jgi:hypothetical protein